MLLRKVVKIICEESKTVGRLQQKENDNKLRFLCKQFRKYYNLKLCEDFADLQEASSEP